MFRKIILRDIKDSIGRYAAVVLIVALGVAFFSGLHVSSDAMNNTADRYFTEHSMFDFRVISSIGWDDDSVKTVAKAENIRDAEGAVSFDAICTEGNGKEDVITFNSITKKTNTLNLKAGRMPRKSNECVADARRFDKSDIGREVEITDSNTKENIDRFSHRKYKITGIVTSPLYLSYARGSSDLGNGEVDAFLFIKKSGFTTDRYTEIYMTMEKSGPAYSDEYGSKLKETKPGVKKAAEKAVPSMPAYMPQGDVYVLTRNSNVGYSTFDDNSNIVKSVSRIFPFFFFLVAVLVVVTTITRMIEEQRTQAGVLRALGYRRGAVLLRYLFYSGSAAAAGAVAGYFIGTKYITLAIWRAYSMIYDFTDSIDYLFDAKLAVIMLAVSLVCITGAALASCVSELRLPPAQLIRPRAPKEGKRVLLERVPFIWKRLSFLHKVAIRNLFRYKKRLLMMIVGISGCTALLVAGFGIGDTIRDVADHQYEEVVKYDYSVTFESGLKQQDRTDFLSYSGKNQDNVLFLNSTDASLSRKGKTCDITLLTSDGENFGSFMDLHSGGSRVSFPGGGRIAICRKLQKRLGVKTGDKITLRRDYGKVTLTVSGVFDNYISEYAVISEKTYQDAFGKAAPMSTAYVKAGKNASENDIRKEAMHCGEFGKASGTSVNLDMHELVNRQMSSLDSVVWMIIICAGLLAFIVLYNLTNINITERTREIATVKVLGFYPNETAAYVFRENFMLTGIGALIGLLLGRLLLDFVINEIDIDLLFFETRVSAAGYIWSFLLTFVFASVVMAVMHRKLGKINMAQSLTAAE